MAKCLMENRKAKSNDKEYELHVVPTKKREERVRKVVRKRRGGKACA